MPYQIWNRRYTGSKYKLSNWISGLIHENCVGNSFCDLFAGTAIMSKQMIDSIDEIYINDFLYSNEIIYKAFFEQSDYDLKKLEILKNGFMETPLSQISENYVSKNFGNKFFSYNDSLRIGYIREKIENDKTLNEKEKNILIASLLYSLDKSANTVGHYDAYIKGKPISDTFLFDLIEPYKFENKKYIFRGWMLMSWQKTLVAILFILIRLIIQGNIVDFTIFLKISQSGRNRSYLAQLVSLKQKI